VQAGEGRLDLYSTDMELSIKADLATPVEREGEIVVPARLFSDVVRNLPDEDVLVEAGDGPAVLHAELDPAEVVSARRTNPSLANRRL